MATLLKQLFLKRFWLAMLFPLMQFSLTAQAAPVQEQYKEGEHYRVLNTPAPTSAGKNQIDVTEVFWYGCPHCYTLEPIMDAWRPKLKADTVFNHVPGFFGPNIWKTHAQLYYALESMVSDKKKLHTIHDNIFAEVQNRRNRLDKVDVMGEYLNKKFGLDRKLFASYYNSFGVLNLLNQAGSKIRSYDLTGVPAIIIDGRFVVEPKVGLAQMPAVSDFLIEKVRKERAAKAKAQ